MKCKLFGYECLSCAVRVGAIRSLCDNCVVLLKESGSSGVFKFDDIKSGDIKSGDIKSGDIKYQGAFDQLAWVLDYNQLAADLLKSYKFYHKFYLGNFLQECLREKINSYFADAGTGTGAGTGTDADASSDEHDFAFIQQAEVVIPMPLHWRRLCQRGFNQAVPFARVISRSFNIPVSYWILRKIKHTKPQSLLRAKARHKNLAGVFSVNIDKLKGFKKVLLVDDVITTGRSAHYAAAALKQAGVEWVGVLTLLRA